MSVVRGRPPGLGGRDQRRQEGVLVIAQGLAGAEIADQRPALRGPHGLPPGKAAPLLERPARPLRLTPRQGGASFSNGLLGELERYDEAVATLKEVVARGRRIV